MDTYRIDDNANAAKVAQAILDASYERCDMYACEVIVNEFDYMTTCTHYLFFTLNRKSVPIHVKNVTDTSHYTMTTHTIDNIADYIKGLLRLDDPSSYVTTV